MLEHRQQGRRGLHDVVHRAEQRRVGGHLDPRVGHGRLVYLDVVPARGLDPVAGHRDHLGCRVDADHPTGRADLVEKGVETQSGAAADVEDDVARGERKGVHDRLPEPLEHAGPVVVAAGVARVRRKHEVLEPASHTRHPINPQLHSRYRGLNPLWQASPVRVTFAQDYRQATG